MDIEEAAKRIRMEPSEVAEVLDHEYGPVIVTTDGVKMIDLQRPDANGLTGLVFFERPDGKALDDPTAPPYVFPVFVAPNTGPDVEHVTEPTEPGTDDDGATRVNEPAPPPPAKAPARNASRDAWVEWALEQGAEPEWLETLSRDDLVAEYAPSGD
jgi:hypothetical protein